MGSTVSLFQIYLYRVKQDCFVIEALSAPIYTALTEVIVARFSNFLLLLACLYNPKMHQSTKSNGSVRMQIAHSVTIATKYVITTEKVKIMAVVLEITGVLYVWQLYDINHTPNNGTDTPFKCVTHMSPLMCCHFKYNALDNFGWCAIWLYRIAAPNNDTDT